MNKRHQAFADEYLANTQNATQAYSKVYKIPKSKIRTAEVNGNKLLSNTEIKEYIDAKLEKISDTVSKKVEITLQHQLERLEKLIDPEEGIVKSAKDYIAVLQEESKLLGLYAPEKIKNFNVETPLSEEDKKDLESAINELGG